LINRLEKFDKFFADAGFKLEADGESIILNEEETTPKKKKKLDGTKSSRSKLSGFEIMQTIISNHLEIVEQKDIGMFFLLVY
jgi:hypothetical protein